MRILIICLVFFVCACSSSSEEIIKDNNNDVNVSDDNPSNESDTSLWSIPVNEVYDGGPGKDGIPSIDTPNFVEVSKVGELLDDFDLIIGYLDKEGLYKAYPHRILDWHEIVNDKDVVISYCPLTGTAFGWGDKRTFGVSGLLYNNNLILYDRGTNSFWSQLLGKCVSGKLVGTEALNVSLIETTWRNWKRMFPNSMILSFDTGFSKNYEVYPYGDYIENDDFFLFPVSIQGDLIPNKERVFAIIDGDKSKVYRRSSFGSGLAIVDTFLGNKRLVVGDSELIVSFDLDQSNESLLFEYIKSNDDILFKDSEGNKWNAFGEAIEGPRKGEKMKANKSLMSYWFAITAFYPNPEVYN